MIVVAYTLARVREVYTLVRTRIVYILALISRFYNLGKSVDKNLLPVRFYHSHSTQSLYYSQGT